MWKYTVFVLAALINMLVCSDSYPRTFINLHMSPSEAPQKCLFCPADSPSICSDDDARPFYEGIIPAERFGNPSQTLYPHLICDRCLLGIIDSGEKVMDIRCGCTGCKQPASYVNFVGYIRDIACKYSRNIDRGSLISQLFTKLFNRMIRVKSERGFVFSLHLSDPAKLIKMNQCFDGYKSENKNDVEPISELLLSYTSTFCKDLNILINYSENNLQISEGVWLLKNCDKVPEEQTGTGSFGTVSTQHMRHMLLYSKVLSLDPESDLKFYYRIASRRNWAEGSIAIEFLEAKAMSVLNQPNIPPSIVTKYLALYIMKKQSTHSPLICQYVAKYMEEHTGIEEKYESVLEAAFIANTVSYQSTTIGKANQYFGMDGFSLTRLLSLISRIAKLIDEDYCPNKDESTQLLARLIHTFYSDPFRAGMQSSLTDIRRIFVLANTYTFIKKDMYELRHTILSATPLSYTTPTTLSAHIIIKIAECELSNDFDAMCTLISCFEDVSPSFGIRLYWCIMNLPPKSDIRTYALVELVASSIITNEKFIKANYPGTILSHPDYYISYLRAIASSLAFTLINLKDANLAQHTLDTMALFKKLYDQAAQTIVGGLFNDILTRTDSMILYVFTFYYNSFVASICRNPELYLVVFPKVPQHICALIIHELIEEMISTHVPSHFLALETAVELLYTSGTEMQQLVHITHDQLYRILERLVRMGVQPLALNRMYHHCNNDFFDTLMSVLQSVLSSLPTDAQQRREPEPAEVIVIDDDDDDTEEVVVVDDDAEVLVVDDDDRMMA